MPPTPRRPTGTPFKGKIGGNTKEYSENRDFRFFRSFSIFPWGFWPQNLSQWRSRPLGINFAIVDAQSHSLTIIFVIFWTFQWSVGPQFPTLFEKIDPLRPLRPKCSVENGPILILYSFDVHQNLPILLSFTNQIQHFLTIPLFHFKPF